MKSLEPHVKKKSATQIHCCSGSPGIHSADLSCVLSPNFYCLVMVCPQWPPTMILQEYLGQTLLPLKSSVPPGHLGYSQLPWTACCHPTSIARLLHHSYSPSLLLQEHPAQGYPLNTCYTSIQVRPNFWYLLLQEYPGTTIELKDRIRTQ